MCIRDRSWVADAKAVMINSTNVRVNMLTGVLPEPMMSVSYTHLDVYKRQELYSIVSMGKCPVFLPPMLQHS